MSSAPPVEFTLSDTSLFIGGLTIHTPTDHPRPGQTPTHPRIRQDTVNWRPLRILLECILVLFNSLLFIRHGRMKWRYSLDQVCYLARAVFGSASTSSSIDHNSKDCITEWKQNLKLLSPSTINVI